jgi:Predicted membrane protein
MKSPLLTTQPNSLELDIVLLMTRLVMGAVFIIMGWPKVQQPISWMGPGSGFPGFFQLLAAIAEFIGGIALVIGFLTRIAAFGIACTMVVATWSLVFSWHLPFIDMQGGSAYYPNLLLLVSALLLMVTSAGRISLDRLLFGVNIKKTVI